MSDIELIAALKAAVCRERESRIDVLRLLIEFEKRRLAAPEGQSSLFHYCTRKLGYSEDAAYKRIKAVRTIAKFPILLRWLKKGRVHMGAVVALSSRLTHENHRELLERAVGKSVRELEFLSASLAPRPDKADHVRVLSPAESFALETTPPKPIVAKLISPSEAIAPVLPSVPIKRDDIDPLSAERVRIAFTASRELWTLLERARALLRGRHPDGKFERIFEDALRALLREVDPLSRAGSKALAQLKGDRSRYIPRAVRDAVWKRDGGRCTFTAPDGERCPADGRLEIDHAVPWALGGRSDDPGNLRLRCRAHNLMTARRIFGGKVPG